MTKEEFFNILLDIRHFVTDEAEAHDPYEMANQIVSFVDDKLIEVKES